MLYGTNDPGGIVNFVSKRPQFDAERNISLSYGSFDAKRASVDVTGPLDDHQTVAWRLVATADDRNSHRDFVDSTTYAVAPSLTWRAGPSTTIGVLAESVRQDYTFERGFPAAQALIELPRDRFLEEPGLNRANVETDRLMIDLEHRFDERWSLRGAVSLIRSQLEKLNFYPSGLVAESRTLERTLDYSEEETKDRAFQLELTGKLVTGSWQHTMLVGVEHFRNNFHYTFAPFELSSTIDIDDPVYGDVVIPPGFLDTIAFGNEYGSRTTALYVQDQITLSDRWKATAGLRYDRARLFNDDLVDPSASLRRQMQSRVSPRIGFVFQPTPSASLFAGYSTSFNPQIFNPSMDGDLPKPEVGKQVEVGWRQDWLDATLSSTLSVFEIRKSNVTTSDPDNPQFSIQVGEQRSRGTEFELQGRVARGWTANLAAAYVDAEVTEDNTLPVGDRLDSAPKTSASVWLKWRPSAQGLFAGAGIFHVGEREGTLPNNGVQLPSETRLDAMLGYAEPGWDVQLNANNLTNEKQYMPYSGLFIPGLGRNFDVALNLRF